MGWWWRWATAPGDARRILEADERVVTPGFVDIHTHYDAQILWDRMLSISPWHGVTTVLMGNCGFGVAPARPEHRELLVRTLENVEGMSADALAAGMGNWGFEAFPEYLDLLDRRGSAINVAAMVGHTPVRLYVMGEEATERAGTDDEVARMHAIVTEALEAGAAGFATSRSPTQRRLRREAGPEPRGRHRRGLRPGRCARPDGAGHHAGHRRGRPLLLPVRGDRARDGAAHHLDGAARRDDGARFAPGAARAGRADPGPEAAGLPAGHVPSAHVRVPVRGAVHPRVVARLRPASAADLEGKKRVYADPSFRQSLRDATAGPGFMGGLWDRMTIAQCPEEPALDERRLTRGRRRARRRSRRLRPRPGAGLRFAARFRLAVANYDEDEVEELLVHPGTVLGLSDAGAHASQPCDACFSTFLLSHWVRERQSLSLEEAVRMLTSRPAEVIGWGDRGRLAVGLPADVVVLDPATVGSGSLRRVTDLPAGADRLVADAFGIDAVIVNGSVVREDDRDALDPDGPLPGRVVHS